MSVDMFIAIVSTVVTDFLGERVIYENGMPRVMQIKMVGNHCSTYTLQHSSISEVIAMILTHLIGDFPLLYLYVYLVLD